MNFKITFSEDNIRRFGTASDISYKHFIGLLENLYGGLGLWRPSCSLRYRDEDGDFVIVGSQLEWEEMVSLLGKGKVIRLTVAAAERSSGCGRAQGAHPCPGFAFLPSGMPGRFLYHTLHREGIQALDRKDFPAARSLFATLTALKPSDPISHYNLACADSLLGNVEGAASALVRSIEVGYNNLQHLLSDPDLENLQVRCPARFGEICSLLDPLRRCGGECAGKGEAGAPEGPAVVAAPAKVEEVQEGRREEVVQEGMREVVVQEGMAKETESKWSKELEMLHQFGFHSDVVLIELLEQTGGCIQKTIDLLL
eukprot:TRINITY_DN6726_c0_g1_i1.p1 TRINITY_DN6726_c0_g1~~TRINITY_DN6726_c0_g1_i1.p1  ORF type:complete len:312 (+),score=67.93 TRINITY_DN6726_c0_g1_i1:95-1030(+)